MTMANWDKVLIYTKFHGREKVYKLFFIYNLHKSTGKFVSINKSIVKY